MTKASRVPLVGGLLLGVLCPLASVSAQQRPPIADEIAKTYGFDSFGQVDAIRYTFHLELPGLKLARTWIWEPKTDQITYEGPDKDKKPVKVTYKRSDIANQSPLVKELIDPSFFNDQYWLVFPFHLVWDTGATVEDAGMKKLPLGKGSARKVVVKYPPSGGYLPGDTWEIYVGKDLRIQEMFFRRGGSTKPTIVAANWTNYKKAGPLLVSLNHKGKADGKAFTLFFTKVAIRLNGSTNWTEAK